MKVFIKDFEIMVFVGLCELLVVVIQVGVDFIYFGIESLNMCVCFVSIFIVNDLCEIVQICDKYGIKSYFMINIIIYDEDIVLMCIIVDVVKEVGISVVIVVDVVVMVYCCEVGQEVYFFI